MGRATGPYLKPARKLSVPGVAFAVRVWTSERVGANPLHRVQEWYGASACVSYRRRGKWSAPQDVYVSTPDALREWLSERALRGRVNWVIAPLALEALTLSGWWDYAERKGVTTKGAVGRGATRRTAGTAGQRVRIDTIGTSGRCDLCEYSDDGIRWRWVGERNYWPDSGEVEGSDGGEGESAGDGARDGGGCGSDVGISVVARTLSRFLALVGWWERIATAPFGRTAGQLAVGILRSHAPDRVLCEHRCDDTARLERECSYGGRASVWYIRDVSTPTADLALSDIPGRAPDTQGTQGPITQVDVSSMYPTLLRDLRYPVRRIGLRGEMSADELIQLCAHSGVIARVRIRTDRAEYPLRRGESVIYPIGEFDTVLAGPDLLELANHGSVLRVHCCAYYHCASPFREPMERLLEARQRAREGARPDDEAFAKLCANSLAGRLALREGGWRRESALDEPGRWGEETEMSVKTGTVVRRRYLCGACWTWDEEKFPRGPYCAAFAYLTSYGRQHMRRIRDTLPPLSVVSQHTDGLFLLPSAVRCMTAAGTLARREPGHMRIEDSADSGRWWGPAHYRFGAKWVLSGYHDKTVDPETFAVRSTCHTPLFASRPRGAPNSVTVVTSYGAMPSYRHAGRVREDGWIDPPHILPGREVD